jgi:hypothetical protein
MKGKVTDSRSGRPLAKTSVVLLAGQDRIAETTTNQKGEYEFQGLRSGKYGISYTWEGDQPGYWRVDETLILRPGYDYELETVSMAKCSFWRGCKIDWKKVIPCE